MAGSQMRGFADDVAHLEHGGAEPLTHQSAPAVFTEGEDGKPDHVRAAARHRGPSGQARQAKNGTDRCGGDGQSQGDSMSTDTSIPPSRRAGAQWPT